MKTTAFSAISLKKTLTKCENLTYRKRININRVLDFKVPPHSV
jgi:hypothetical protein